ncbi:hypothetical protein DPMN_152821 [Dreissena polymorpha]|uniref:Uncharacterized protein n=1 Tax=Dreissena polymorpha TaxID=45954 RepID=A0A9D4FML0_DREPO|nr:hypothetical protein DPMN_152821 [Dreissena polymorpha]
MWAPVDPAPAKEQRTRWRRRNAAETALVPEPASAPVQGPKPEVALAAAPPAKRKRADDNAENGEVVDFCDIFRTADGLPRGHNVGKHEAQSCNEKTKSYLNQVCLEWIIFKECIYCLDKLMMMYQFTCLRRLHSGMY